MEISELQAPDWSHWKRLNEVTLWQAIQLSMNVCPNNYAPGSGLCPVADQKYWGAQIISFEWIRSKKVDWVVHRGPWLLSAQDIYVDFPKFVKWFCEVVGATRSPDEFKRLYAQGFNLGAKLPPNEYVPIARNIAKHFIDSQSPDYKLTQETLAKKLARELEVMGIRGVNGGTISDATIRKQALTSDDWFQRFKPNQQD